MLSIVIMVETVLVTGGNGFLASYIILRLLANGYPVRGTTRNSDRDSKVQKTPSFATYLNSQNFNFVIVPDDCSRRNY